MTPYEIAWFFPGPNVELFYGIVSWKTLGKSWEILGKIHSVMRSDVGSCDFMCLHGDITVRTMQLWL